MRLGLTVIDEVHILRPAATYSNSVKRLIAVVDNLIARGRETHSLVVLLPNHTSFVETKSQLLQRPAKQLTVMNERRRNERTMHVRFGVNLVDSFDLFVRKFDQFEIRLDTSRRLALGDDRNTALDAPGQSNCGCR
jgi:hypothetical protein